MKWYSKYLPVYEKPFAEVPAETVAEVRAKLAERQSDRPLATVSVIACNEEKRLTACLWSLAEQRCRYPMEIIATDNLSKDRTAEIFETLGLPWQRETTPGCGHARLCGLNRARGKYHINIDADTIYPPRYVETMVDALERRGVVAGQFAVELHSRRSPLRRRTLALRTGPRHAPVAPVVPTSRIERPRTGFRLRHRAGPQGGHPHRHHPRRGRIAGPRTQAVRPHRLRPQPPARAVTGYGTVSKDGTLLDSFRVRAVKALKGLGGMFFKKSEYKDEEDNLLK